MVLKSSLIFWHNLDECTLVHTPKVWLSYTTWSNFKNIEKFVNPVNLEPEVTGGWFSGLWTLTGCTLCVLIMKTIGSDLFFDCVISHGMTLFCPWWKSSQGGIGGKRENQSLYSYNEILCFPLVRYALGADNYSGGRNFVVPFRCDSASDENISPPPP